MSDPKNKKIKILARHFRRNSSRFSPQIREQIRLINALAVQIFLDSKDIQTHNLMPYIRYLIYKFNLVNYLCEVDVFIEAYTRAIEKTQTGYVINNPPSWFKGAALNIVRNIKGDLKKQESLGKIHCRHQEFTRLSSSDETIEGIQFIVKAFSKLDEDDKYLLNLRTVKGLTWSDIAETMIQEKREPIPADMNKFLAKLRQRHKRALDRLRKNHEMCTKTESNGCDAINA